MYNWSTDEVYFKKYDPEGYKAWRLLQLVNYGLDGEKLAKKELVKYWPRIKDEIFDEDVRRYVEMILWPKSSRCSKSSQAKN